MACLRARTADELATAGTSVANSRTSTIYAFAPIVDGSFLTEGAVAAFNAGRFARVPVLMGYVFLLLRHFV
jgi:carboxylesterase type B